MHPSVTRMHAPDDDSILLVAPIENLQDPLRPEEATAIQNAVESRRREFTAGRTLARLAMQALRFPECAIPTGERRQPLWPEGIQGSISHTEALCAVSMSKTPGMVCGLDLEQTGRVQDELRPRLFRPEEQHYLEMLTAEEAAIHSTVLFGAKEAFFKLQYPLREEWMGFEELSVSIVGQTFQARPEPPLAGFPETGLSGEWSQLPEGLILTVLWHQAS